MEEPSLLDYLKSRLRFWKHEAVIRTPNEEEEGERTSPDSREKTGEIKTFDTEATTETPIHAGNQKGFPWRALLALTFLLLAQRTFEPSASRNAIPGLVLYAIGLTLAVLAMIKEEWKPADPPLATRTTEANLNPKAGQIKLVPLLLTSILSLAAFLTLGRNEFTLLNTALWFSSLACFLWTFWIPKSPGTQTRANPGRIFPWKVTNIRINHWTLLLMATAGLVLTFRIANIGGIPPEPISDHAEKILDVYDVTQGQFSIFFPRNTGREAIQIYLTAGIAWLFSTGLSFLSLKIGTIICGLLTLPYMYLLGKELGGKRVALLALLFTGIAYWPNVIARIGLRFPLYPLFVAPTLYYLIRGLRRNERNQFILAGIALGLGLHGYSPIRILPIVVVATAGIFLIHDIHSKKLWKQTLHHLALLVAVSAILFLPLLRYWLDNPDSFGYRAFSRLSSIETPLSAPVVQVFFSNLWNGLKMFNWDDGKIWVHSVTHRPALDVVSAAFFLAGVVLLLARYIKKRDWIDLFLLISIPLLQLPSILSLAYPAENPALNRAGGAIVPVFLVTAIAMDGLWTGIRSKMKGRGGVILTWGLGLLLLAWSSWQNYDLVFKQFTQQYTQSSWNSSEMGAVIQEFSSADGSTDQTWIIPYPHWVDTRLPGVWAGVPNRDFGVWPEDLETTLDTPLPKLFLVNTADTAGQARLEELYPNHRWSQYNSKTGLPEKDFMIFFVPEANTH